MKRRRKRYDDKFRASAVVMLESQGYPAQEGALTYVSKALDVPLATLHRWFHGKQNPPPSDLVNEKRPELEIVFEEIAYKMLAHASRDDVIEDMSGKDAVIAGATAVDKMRLLKGLPTEIIGVLPNFIQALTQAGKDPKEFMDRVIDRLTNENYVQ
jgi:transposase-like protein